MLSILNRSLKFLILYGTSTTTTVQVLHRYLIVPSVFCFTPTVQAGISTFWNVSQQQEQQQQLLHLKTRAKVTEYSLEMLAKIIVTHGK